MSHIVGLNELLSDLNIMSESVDNCMDEIARETASMIHAESIENVSGPKNPNWKRSGSKVQRKIGKKVTFKKVKYFLKSLKVQGLAEQLYPVSVNTGTLRRSLKLKRLAPGVYKVFADANIANYAYYVHEGTSKMQARPFLDNAVDKVLNDEKYLNVAADIVEKAINK